MDAQSRWRQARVFFLVTGNRRQALMTASHDDATWTAALRQCARASGRGGSDGSPQNTRAWVSNAGPPESVVGVDWIGQALTVMDAEQRACVVIPALLDNGDDRLAAFLGCSGEHAAARRSQAMVRLSATLAQADADRSDSNAPVLTTTSLADALAQVADLGLAETGDLSPAHRSQPWIWRAIMLIIAALVLAPGIAQNVLAPQGVTWQGYGEIEFAVGQLRRIGRGVVTEADWSPDGTRIIVAATTGVYAIDAATLRPIGYFATGAGTRLLGFSPDGAQIATWLDDTLVLRDGIDLHPVYTAAQVDMPGISAVAWSWTGKMLALGGAQGVLLTESRNPARKTLFPSAAGPTHLRFSPDGAWLVIATAAPETLLVRTDGTRMSGIGGSLHPPAVTAFSEDGRRLVGIFGDGVGVADLDRGAWIAVSGRSGLQSSLWVSPDGRHGLVADSASTTDQVELLTINLDSGLVTRRLRVPRDRTIGAMAVRKDGARALVVNADGLSVWDLNTGALVAASVDFAPPRGVELPTPVRFSADGRHLVAPDAYGGLRLLSTATGRTERVLNENIDPFIDAIYSPDGHRIVADNDSGVGLRRLAPGDRTRQHEPALYVFDVESGGITHVFPGARQPQFVGPTVVAYLPAERSELRAYNFPTSENQAWAGVRGARVDAFVASAGAIRVAVLTNLALELWDPAAGMVWRTPLSRTDIDRGLLGRPLAMSGDARLVAVAEPSLGIRVFAGQTGALLGVLARPITVTYDASLENPLIVAISADGRWIATVDNRPTPANTPSSTLTIWRADGLRAMGTPSNFAERVAGIDFSPDSRRLAIIRGDYVIEMLELP